MTDANIAGSATLVKRGSSASRKPASQTRSKYNGLLALFYDLDHAWRPYKKQSRFFSSLFEKSSLYTPSPSTGEGWDGGGLCKGGGGYQIRLLDLCCGSGPHSIWLAKSGFHVTGLDASSVLLSLAQQKARLVGLIGGQVGGQALRYSFSSARSRLIFLSRLLNSR